MRGAFCSRGVVLIRGSTGVGEVIRCPKATVEATSAAKANAARFTVQLLWVHSGRLDTVPPTEAVGDG